MPRINVYIDVSTYEALERRRAKARRSQMRFEASQICEAALRKALRLKEKK